ncbi:FadR/GntR family transcriptional regulator [Rhodococcus rhodochrous]|uniref:FadR/GntR family transcriptional regulator n=1 Tax=Rhodococcus rhodochrous TaxID=1829 RepID=UPI0002EAF3B7|nr:FCD domain-containing protein [Rhodococcus rhodochrous]
MTTPQPDLQIQRSLTRPEQAALTIGRLAESAEPGARLGTKQELQERCGVSKGTFNEALRLLQARGLVTVRSGPGGGLFAAEPTPAVRIGNAMLALDRMETSAADAVRIRSALEPLLIDDAIEFAEPADIARMRQAIDEMSEAAKAQNVLDFLRANWDLHAAIARTSPSRILRSIYLSLLDVLASHTVSAGPADGRPLPDILNERLTLHSDLVEALASKNRQRAQELIAIHDRR